MAWALFVGGGYVRPASLIRSVAATPTRNRLRVIADTGSEPSRTEPVPYTDFGLGADSSRLRVPNMGKD